MSLELYLDDAKPENRTGLYRHGTRVVEDIAMLDSFQHVPWTSGCLQGIIDAPFLNLTPGTRTGILHDERFEALCRALEPAATSPGFPPISFSSVWSSFQSIPKSISSNP